VILNTKEADAMRRAIDDLEAVASLCSPGPTRDAIYRNTAALRALLTKAPVSRSGRADGHPC